MAGRINKSSNKNPNMKERNERAYLSGVYLAEIINNIDNYSLFNLAKFCILVDGLFTHALKTSFLLMYGLNLLFVNFCNRFAHS